MHVYHAFIWQGWIENSFFNTSTDPKSSHAPSTVRPAKPRRAGTDYGSQVRCATAVSLSLNTYESAGAGLAVEAAGAACRLKGGQTSDKLRSYKLDSAPHHSG